jgi:hypothetical protein
MRIETRYPDLLLTLRGTSKEQFPLIAQKSAVLVAKIPYVIVETGWVL